jgi:hypothetical protein
MGFSFTVGIATDVFQKRYAAKLVREFKRQLGIALPTERTAEQFHLSEEVAWTGWRLLQVKAIAELGEENIPHLLAMEAWLGVYLPNIIPPTEINMGIKATPFQCGSLFSLREELEQFAKALSLPTDEAGLKRLWHKYRDDDDRVDDDLHIQTYIQLMLCAQIASRYELPLWVVK